MSITHEKRGTGRTHNMICQALAVGAMNGQSAVVVMFNDQEVHHALTTIVPKCFPPEHAFFRISKQHAAVYVNDRQVLKFIRQDRISREFGNNPNTPHNWKMPGTEVFVDHCVIEHAFFDILQAWTRYDNPHHKVNFHG